MTHTQRTFQRAAQTYAEAEALAEAIGWPGPKVISPTEDAIAGHVQLRPTEFTEGIDLGISGWGTAGGSRARAPARASLGRRDEVLLVGRGHGSLERAAEVVGDLPVERSEAPLTAGSVFAAGRLAVVTEEDLFAPGGTRGRARFPSRATVSVADELEPGDSRSISTASGGTGCGPPRAGRRRT